MGFLPIKIVIVWVVMAVNVLATLTISIPFLKILLADNASFGKLSDFEKVSEYSSLNSCVIIRCLT